MRVILSRINSYPAPFPPPFARGLVPRNVAGPGALHCSVLSTHESPVDAPQANRRIRTNITAVSVIPWVHEHEARTCMLVSQANVEANNSRKVLSLITLHRHPFTITHGASFPAPSVDHKFGGWPGNFGVVIHANLGLVSAFAVREFWPTLTKAPGTLSLSLWRL